MRAPRLDTVRLVGVPEEPLINDHLPAKARRVGRISPRNVRRFIRAAERSKRFCCTLGRTGNEKPFAIFDLSPYFAALRSSGRYDAAKIIF